MTIDQVLSPEHVELLKKMMDSQEPSINGQPVRIDFTQPGPVTVHLVNGVWIQKHE